MILNFSHNIPAYRMRARNFGAFSFRGKSWWRIQAAGIGGLYAFKCQPKNLASMCCAAACTVPIEDNLPSRQTYPIAAGPIFNAMATISRWLYFS
jgi:hypothetical protein